MQYTTVIAELERTIRQAPPSQRLATLRAVTKLFLANAPGLSEDKVEVFDTVFNSLVDKIDNNGLIELSECLAPIENAPPRMIKRLAGDPEIMVARPVLVQSPRLSTDDLVELAQTKSQAHLLAISKRTELPERATDILIQRGNREVVYSVASNRTARLSDRGLAALSMRAAQDERVAAAISGRPDVPPEVFRSLLSNALAQLEAKTRSFAAAQRLVISMKQNSRLGDKEVSEFAVENRYYEVIAALSLLSGLKHELIETLMEGDEPGGLLIVCKALGMSWETVAAILKMKNGPQVASDKLRLTHADFGKLSRSTAERVLRFWQVRQQLAKERLH
ncbi:MAG: DUF2336 domain-containing protein [Pseudolabrys sp.]|nr:DUF2336 domain-containing protein [Pseudolabrys sp.]